jgi:nucleotide-binding universal stress UspA family protein
MAGIVVGVDGSEHAHRALDWAMREAAARHVDLTVLTVVPAQASPWTGHPLTVPDGDAAVERAREAIQEAVTKSASELGDSQPASVTVNAFAGFPARSLIEASQTADLVVVGSRGAGGFATLLLGSTSQQVSHHSACPVVIVPSHREHGG